MKHSVHIDRRSRTIYCKNELARKSTKFLRSNSFFPVAVRAQGAYSLASFFSFESRIHNYCVVTSRSRFILRDFRLSRMAFKSLAGAGRISGVKKGSW